MKIRRVVTGHDAAGRSVVVSDDQIDGFRSVLMPGAESHMVWAADEAPHFPDEGAMPVTDRYFPPVGGFRFGFFSVAPGEAHEVPAAALSPDEIATAMAEYEANFPGMGDYVERDGSGMHTTDTVDMELVVEGQIWLELDDGQLVHLRAGDTLIQNGTRHSWRNLGSETARVAAFICGAHHAKVTRP